MRRATVAFFGIARILAGLLLGYALWGQHAVNLTRELAKTNGELVTTKGWLLDEIEGSDERQGQTSARLTKALTELVHVRGELARIADTRPRTDGTVPRLGNDKTGRSLPTQSRQQR
jgi:hypothetical protein